MEFASRIASSTTFSEFETNAIYEPNSFGLASLDDSPSQHQFERVRYAHDAWEEVTHADIAPRQTHADKRSAEAGAWCCESKVRRKCQTEASTNRCAVDGSDDRLRHRCNLDAKR